MPKKDGNFTSMNVKAKYWQKVEGNIVSCNLCPHRCKIASGMKGACKTRENCEGGLYSLAYGNPCSVSIDPIEKKPLFHFFPKTKIFSLSTAGCNFHCLNCQNWNISQITPNEADNYEMSPECIVREAIRHKTGSMAFTYTEPTVFYEFLLDTARLARENEIKTVIVSNGYINSEPLTELCPWIDAANIDIKTFDDHIYRKLTGGSLQPVLDTLIALRKNGVWLEITNLIIPGWSDNSATINLMCKWLSENGFADTPLHFSRFFPAYKLPELNSTPEKTMIMAAEIAASHGIKYIYLGNMPQLSRENTNCSKCGKAIIERYGFRVRSHIGPNGECPFCGNIIPGIWK